MILGQYLINGIASGAIYALLAVGFAMIYNTTKMLHIAHAVVYTGGAYVYYTCAILLGMGLWFAMPFAIAGATLLGLSIEVGIYRPIRRLGGGTNSILIASLGTISLLQGVYAVLFTTDTRTLRQGPLPAFIVGGDSITSLHVAVLAVVAVTFPLLQLFLRRSRIGIAIRALADNPALAEVHGMDTRRLYAIIMMIGSALAGAAAILVSLDLGVKPDMGFDAVFTSVVAVVVGGVGYLPGALLGAFMLALLQQLAVWQLNSAWQNGVVFGTLVIFLILRPQGVFGGRMASRRA
ncbi:MAG TPA: branched-chain amino acid ABC transporter permease [Stellaceae bacterium]|nr:branched-chain amino acid ABC transporter permease [Stellaceae bacterium]